MSRADGIYLFNTRYISILPFCAQKIKRSASFHFDEHISSPPTVVSVFGTVSPRCCGEIIQNPELFKIWAFTLTFTSATGSKHARRVTGNVSVSANSSLFTRNHCSPSVFDKSFQLQVIFTYHPGPLDVTVRQRNVAKVPLKRLLQYVYTNLHQKIGETEINFSKT